MLGSSLNVSIYRRLGDWRLGDWRLEIGDWRLEIGRLVGWHISGTPPFPVSQLWDGSFVGLSFPPRQRDSSLPPVAQNDTPGEVRLQSRQNVSPCLELSPNFLQV
ncbi:MAG: hypothetical protein D6796_16590 [Caldilineae bacterium]|nr:MAG: hypothetical protein D6796_16590 [Caldilineae bacterium]